MQGKRFSVAALVLALVSMSGCATDTVGVSRLLKLYPTNTLSVLTLLPDVATVVVDHGATSKDPLRLVPATSWGVNPAARRSVLNALEKQSRFRVRESLPPGVQQWLSGATVREGIALNPKTLARIRKPVSEMRTNLVLVLAPGMIFAKGVYTMGSMSAIFGPVVGYLVSGGVRPEGLGYGVVQTEFLDTRSAVNTVALKAWVLDREEGTVIAKTSCVARSTRLNGVGKTNPKVKALWIHRKGAIAPANLAYTKTEILKLTQKAVGCVLHALKLS